jgi:hypothetical protein
MQRALEASLAQDLPTSPYHVALELGFVSDCTLRRKFPRLFKAIQEKIDNCNALRITEMGRALIAALAEDPPPTLGKMCHRLGYSRPVVLRKHFPKLCDQLLVLQRAHRVREVEKLRSQLLEFSLESPAISLEHACRRVDYSRQQLLRLCPEECALVVANFDRSSHESAQRKLEELHRRAHQIVTTLHQQGKLPSFKRVSALLGSSVLNNWRERVTAIRVAKAGLANRLPDFARSGL